MNPLSTPLIVESLPSLIPFALASVGLFLKSFLTVLVQARERLRTREFAYEEDARQWRGTLEPGCSELHLRASSALRNDRENIPYFLGLGVCYVLLGGSSTFGWLYCGGFLAARALHTLAFLLRIQPLRNQAFGVSFTVLMGLVVHVVVLVF